MHYPSMQFIPTWSINEFSAIVIPAGTDIAFNGERVFSISSGADNPNFGPSTMFPCHSVWNIRRCAHPSCLTCIAVRSFHTRADDLGT